jgi:hypothetical protein
MFLSLIPREFNAKLSDNCLSSDSACIQLAELFLKHLNLPVSDEGLELGLASYLPKLNEKLAILYSSFDAEYLNHHIFYLAAHTVSPSVWPFWLNLYTEEYTLEENVHHLTKVTCYTTMLDFISNDVCNGINIKEYLTDYFQKLCASRTPGFNSIKALLSSNLPIAVTRAELNKLHLFFYIDYMANLRNKIRNVPLVFDPVRVWNCHTIYLDKHCLEIIAEIDQLTEVARNRLLRADTRDFLVSGKDLFVMSDQNFSKKAHAYVYPAVTNPYLSEQLEFYKKELPFYYAARGKIMIKSEYGKANNKAFVWPFWEEVLNSDQPLHESLFKAFTRASRSQKRYPLLSIYQKIHPDSEVSTLPELVDLCELAGVMETLDKLLGFKSTISVENVSQIEEILLRIY